MRRYLLITLLFVSQNLWAKRFANQYCEFELPSGWECSLEGSEWVCQSENKDRKREAIIILAAKMRGKEDVLDEYKKYLKGSKSYQLPGGAFQNSEPKYTKETVINGHKWIDALHLASEVPGFYTRYLATVKKDLGIAVTFSVAKSKYEEYQNVFDRTVQTLRVFNQENKDLTDIRVNKGADDDVSFANTTFIPDENQFDIAARKNQKSGGSSGSDDLFLFLILVSGIGFYIYKKKKK